MRKATPQHLGRHRLGMADGYRRYPRLGFTKRARLLIQPSPDGLLNTAEVFGNGCGGWICRMLHGSRDLLDRPEVGPATVSVTTHPYSLSVPYSSGNLLRHYSIPREIITPLRRRRYGSDETAYDVGR